MEQFKDAEMKNKKNMMMAELRRGHSLLSFSLCLMTY